jgi:mannose-6-phosphate isomerase class I
MKLQKFRWSKVYESQEEELVRFMQARKLTGTRATLDQLEQSDQQQVEAGTTIWCAEGSFTLFAGTTSIAMQPGDALPISESTMMHMNAGISGCVYYETLSKATAL